MFIKLKDVKDKDYVINLEQIEYISPMKNGDRLAYITVKMKGNYAIKIDPKEWSRLKAVLSNEIR